LSKKEEKLKEIKRGIPEGIPHQRNEFLD